MLSSLFSSLLSFSMSPSWHLFFPFNALIWKARSTWICIVSKKRETSKSQADQKGHPPLKTRHAVTYTNLFLESINSEYTWVSPTSMQSAKSTHECRIVCLTLTWWSWSMRRALIESILSLLFDGCLSRNFNGTITIIPWCAQPWTWHSMHTRRRYQEGPELTLSILTQFFSYQVSVHQTLESESQYITVNDVNLPSHESIIHLISII